ncbi:MAG TPA: hypothetical protein VHZ75_02405 [Solirubrobacteraceae bacterium]|jgi:hypothetical protein|nr:hypothetical protein [Solirubrobacteraceae bacterium]
MRIAVVATVALLAAVATPRLVAGQAAAQPAVAPAAQRLRLIVAPTRVRLGHSPLISVSDSRRSGGVSGIVCASAARHSKRCRTIHLRAGKPVLALHIPLTAARRWTISLRSASGGGVARRTVDVGRAARYRVLVTGDSMVYGIIDVLGRSVRATGGTLHGDPNPGSGITKPMLVDWPVHARASVRTLHPDATVVFLGAAVDAFPLTSAAGQSIDCCGREWIAAYARRVHAMMTTYLRGGHALVYWVLLPLARDPARTESIKAINAAITQAAASIGDGVRLVDIAPDVTPHGQYTDTIAYHGKQVAVREPDGMHLANAGVHIATTVILRAMRRDGLVEP